MKTFLTLTRFKAWSTIAVLASFWLSRTLGAYFGKYLGAALLLTINPENAAEIEKAAEMENSLVPFREAMEIMANGILTAEIAAAVLISYLCACSIAFLANQENLSK